jgi:hypothetical protein
MISVPVSTSDAFSFGRPRLLFEGNYRLDHSGQSANYDVSPDGKSFVMVQPDPEARSEITVVLNWAEELKRLAPAN